MEERTIVKLLSANDTGETGGHQAGILVPRDEDLLSFFPKLNRNERNPRAHIHFTDQAGDEWGFAFIYYNNRFFGGTRNEYRLTRMTRYIRESGLVTGDEILLTRSASGDYTIGFRRHRAAEPESRDVVRLTGGWRIIDI